MGRTTAVLAALTTVALGGALALVGAAPAQAATEQHWGAFTLSGENRAYTGTMSMPGFPATTFTSNSRQSAVVSGASTWQSAATPPGERYGTSRGQTYLNQRPLRDQPNASSASTTVYTFAEVTPVGSWSLVLGDVDADQATISATDASGATLPPSALGFQSAYNSCSAAVAGGWSCPPDPDGSTGRDVPTWDPATGTLTGNAAAADTAGATGWFTPTVPLKTLTVTYQQRSGLPVYQTWFGSRTAALQGTATIDGAAYPGALVTVTAPRGVVYTATTDATGAYTFPELPQIGGYTVTVEPPTGATGAGTATGVSLIGQDGTADLAFTAPTGTSSVVGTVVGEDHEPVADLPVTVTPPGAAPVDTVTNDAGTYVVSGLPPSTDVEVSVDGGTPTTVRTGAVGEPPTTVPPITAPAAAIAVVSGDVLVNDTEPVVGAEVELLDADGTVVATTTTGDTGSYTFPAVPRGTYKVRVVNPPAGLEGDSTATADATAGDVVVPIRFRAAPELPPVTSEQIEQPGLVVDAQGQPAPDRTVTATPVDTATGPVLTTTTGADGAFALEGLAPEADYTVSTPGAEPVAVTTPSSGSAPTITLTLAAATAPPTTPPTTPPVTTPGGGVVPVASVGSDGAGVLAYSGSQPVPALLGGGLLLLAGLAFLVARGIRARRHRDHLQD